jgi:polyisoprenoid-binding protein YceI
MSNMTSRRALPLLVALAAAPAHAMPRRYLFTEREGRIAFLARHLGLLRSEGQFGRFRAELEIDPDRPEAARVSGAVETASASVPYPGADELLRSEAFFDSARHPEASFQGVAPGAGSAERFPIEGTLTIRGISRPWRLEARLLGRERTAEGEVARFEAAGRLSRSAYGMVAERALISDEIGLVISVQIRL